MISLFIGLLVGVAHADTPATSEARTLLRAMGDFPDQAPTSGSGTPWWESISDSTLHTLVRDGLQHNPNMRATQERIILARANTWQSLSGMLPTISADLQGQIQPTDGLGLSPMTSTMPDYGAAFEGLAQFMAQMAETTGQDPATLPSVDVGGGKEPPDTYRQGSIMLNGSLPIDFTTRQLHGYLASRHEVTASRAEVAAQRVMLSGQLADAWYDLVAARQQVNLIEAQASANQELLELVQMRYESGEGTALDVLQQRQQLAGTEALLPRARGSLTAAQQIMNILTGRAPGSPLPESTGLPDVGPAPAKPHPARILIDRPDLAQAIAKLDAARLNRTSTFLSLAPTLGLTGSVGRQYLRLEETDHVDTWSVGGALSIPLFAGGRTHAGIRAATAQRDMAAEGLRGQVLAVVQQLNTAHTQDEAAAESLEATQRQRTAAQNAYTESRSRYRQGLIPYVNVLMALGAHQAAELAFLDAQRARLRARVQLHTARGGTWARRYQEVTP